MPTIKKRCANLACGTPQLQLRGEYCTASKCKQARAEGLAHGKMVAALADTGDSTVCVEIFKVAAAALEGLRNRPGRKKPPRPRRMG